MNLTTRLTLGTPIMTSSRFMVVAALLVLATTAFGQGKKAQEEADRASAPAPLDKVAGIEDRAGGTHNRSNIGLFFENRGKLYPRRASQGPSGDFPIGSKKEYVYRINTMVGVPGNVVQGRYTTNEEWEAAAGYSSRDSAQIAFSDKPYTWPGGVWPVNDALGNPVFVSDQDSYCVYNDSTNSRGMLGLEMHQTGYAFGMKSIRNMIFFTFQLVNRSSTTHDSLYFALYVDMDVGNYSGGDPEYADDRLGYDRNLQLIYFYDDGKSSEWPGNTTGYMGMAVLKTPEVNGVQVGVTDMHYNIYDDDIDIDSIQYGIMSSQPGLFNSPDGPRYFHLGANAPNLHFDDPATIPPSGLDLLANLGSGPYTMAPGDTLSFVTALVAGETYDEIITATNAAYELMDAGFVSAQAPDPPLVTAVAGDRSVTIFWDDRSEKSRDRFSDILDFEGYRLYKSTDRGQHWDQIDRNIFPGTGPDPVPLAAFDKVNSLGPDAGLQYSYLDTNVVNGFEYWYSVTAYDRGDSSTPSLESPRGNNAEAVNLDIAFPLSAALGRSPVTATPVTQSGTGSSNDEVVVSPADVPGVGDGQYEIQFEPFTEVAGGNPRPLVQATVTTAGSRTFDRFSISFPSEGEYRVIDLTRDSVLIPTGLYISGTPIEFEGLSVVITDTAAVADQQIQAGDSLLLRPGIRVNRTAPAGGGGFSLRGFDYGTQYATVEGIAVVVRPANPVRRIQQVAGVNPLTVAATVTDAAAIRDETYNLLVEAASGSGSSARLKVVLRTAGGVEVGRNDSLPSGGSVPGVGFTLTVGFNSALLPTVGTTVQVQTEQPRAVEYRDRFTFGTVAPSVSADQIAAGIDRIKVVPNPYLVSSLFEEEFGTLRREPIRRLLFNNLPTKCTITIFTIDGDKVKTLEHNSTTGTESWNMLTEGGREIAPGVYIYLVQADNAEFTGRFAVIK